MKRFLRHAGSPTVPSSPLAAWASVSGMTGRAAWVGPTLYTLALVAGRFKPAEPVGQLAFALSTPLAAALLLALASRLLPVRFDRWTTVWMLAALAGSAGAFFANRWYLHVADPDLVLVIGGTIAERALLVWLVCIALPLLYHQRQAQRSEMDALKLNAVTAELKALQAQVEPHFLYNTLANTRYLARHQPERAVEMLDHLIAYLHQALPDMRSRSSDVARECELARHYLALMAIRFGERLSFSVDVAEDAAGAEMPPLLLMSLVENAVRHGVEPLPGAVRVEVTARRAGGELHLCVTDSGAGPGGSVLGSGVGLRNLRERLAALYGARAAFALSRTDGVTRAELTLPFIAATESSA